MSRTTRRAFLKTAAASTVYSSFVISGTKSSGEVLGANNRVRIGVAGLNGRGNSHIGAWLNAKDVEIAYLIDPDSKLHGKADNIEKKQSARPQTVQDIRKALEDKNLDAVSVATPNHWHALIGIWACQAGKDAYVEKPCSHNIYEGRKLLEAARKYKRIVQHGTQSRSSGGLAKRAADIAAGKLGKLKISHGSSQKPRRGIGQKDPSTPPEHLDFNVWLGPAAEQPFHGNLVHYNWHWFWEFGNGEIGNQGVHQMDIARWMIPNAKLPNKVLSYGGRFAWNDQGVTPNVQVTIFDYGDTLLVFENRNLSGRNVSNHQIFDQNESMEPVQIESETGVKDPTASRGPGGIFDNFIHAVRSRDESSLDAHVSEAHYSAALCHLGNISYRLGEDLPFVAKGNRFGDNKVAAEYLTKVGDYLKGNGVKLEEADYRVGRILEIDAAKESIVGDAEANALLTRAYREPFVVPKQV